MKHQILIVDDERMVRHSLCSLLRRQRSYAVTEASDGLEAVVKCKQSPFDLAVVDVRMPKMNGLEALERMRYFWPEMPVIMISEFTSIEMVEYSMRLGAFCFLAKPVDPIAFLDKIVQGVNHTALQQA